MNLPDPPPIFRQPSPAERPWWWRLEDAAGTEVELTGPAAEEYGDRRFASQADAESWIGETWSAPRRRGRRRRHPLRARPRGVRTDVAQRVG
ncbi:hypothetical protein [Nocardioides sp. TF02-7]|uniref:hypothetical protein n=1 Tax=Nocardioides sp. TF02-7 TaxID=2917724 RepID=UPI001F067CD8|nr:hypothetical protein [Nocardioides sp. TF02-7]UMG92706.1 hypothetical protein MF408_23810 [Nocardioides sp. TF02-7]